MNKISIAIFVWGLNGGAIANNASAMAQGFANLGIKQIYLIYLSKGPGKNVAISPEIKLVSLGIKRSIFSVLSLANFIKRERPDYLISMPTIINIPAIIGWILARNKNTKLIVSEHSTMSYKSYVEYKQDLRMRIMPWLARKFYPMATGIRANSEEVLEDLLNEIRIPVSSESTITIANPVNIEAVTKYSKDPLSHPWFKDKTKPIIISVARLAKQKNFPLLIKAFALVKQKVDARLIILGEGPERENLETLISQLKLEESIALPGFCNNPWSYMSKSDVFVLASEEEPFGLAIVEAMACDLPVVVTDAFGGGPRTILENNQYGILVPNHSEKALGEAIVETLTNSELRNRLVVAGKERCQMYRPEIIAQEWLTFLQNLK